MAQIFRMLGASIASVVVLSGVLLAMAMVFTGAHVTVDRHYTYDAERHIVAVAPTVDPHTLTTRVTFDHPRDVFFVRIPNTFARTLSEDDLHITWTDGTHTIHLPIDTEGDERPESERFITAEPVFFPLSGTVTLTLSGRVDLSHTPHIEIIAVNSTAFSYHIGLGGADTAQAGADTSGVKIVSRKDWGADEELRYSDSSAWKTYFDEQSGATASTGRTRNMDINDYLQKNFADDYSLVSRQTLEGGRPLVWPIEKTKRVEKIVVHHTDENNVTEHDDATLMRGIYYYHAMVRGWGDIGYNYVIGHDGTVYEGRAGGDYVVGAHAVWDNRSTVGISVMGNFEEETPAAAQVESLNSLVHLLAKKYGIDVSKTSPAHRACQNADECLVHDYVTVNLVGHRDVGYTLCP